MRFIAVADTDIGNTKKTNQDSLLIKHANSAKGEVLMAIICDGMGGLDKGELASATVIRRFDQWFEKELPVELISVDMQVIGAKWALLLKELNVELLNYSQEVDINLGTTFTGVLFIEDHYTAVHVGDTRLYYIGETIRQMTEDQTFVAREITRGTMTIDEAKTDKRRNMLLQCVGASRTVEPQVMIGETKKGSYLICSDGFRHEITEEEMHKTFECGKAESKKKLQKKIRTLIDLVKTRKERDNISAILIAVN